MVRFTTLLIFKKDREGEKRERGRWRNRVSRERQRSRVGREGGEERDGRESV